MKRLLNIGMLILSSVIVFGTLPSHKIDHNNFDYKLYEKLLFVKVNNYRKANGLKPLLGDKLLYKVASNQSNYLKTSRVLTHNQPTIGNRNVQERLTNVISATSYTVGENIARTFVLKPTYNYLADGSTKISTATTYDEAATYMFNSWINSKVHRDNIVSSKFEIAAIAAYYNPANKSLTAVQVFATIR